MIDNSAYAILFIFFCTIQIVKADHKEPTCKVNQNKQTDLFYRATGNWSRLQNDITNQKDKAIGGIKSQEGLEALGTDSEIRKNANELDSISPFSLNSKGREKMIKDNMFYEIHVDYSSPVHKRSLSDARKIANAQNSLLRNLLSKLREIGVDCRTTRGPVEKEPAYFLDIKKDKHHETIYNKETCREKRNKYDCVDSLSMHCRKRRNVYGKWENKKFKLDGHYVYRNHNHWGYGIKWKIGRWGWHVYSDTCHHPGRWRRNSAKLLREVKNHIARKTGARIDEIENIKLPTSGRGIGSITRTYDGDNVAWKYYEVSYRYHKFEKEVCDDWEETWTERCRITTPDRSVPSYRKKGKRDHSIGN